MPTYRLPDGTTVSDTMSFTWNDFQYPDNWIRCSTEDERKVIGLTGPLPEPPAYDQQFYWGPGQPKDHKQLIELWCGHVRANAGALLQPTDWMVIRAVEQGSVEPDETLNWRQQVRDASNDKINKIEATTTVEELRTYVTSSEYIAWPTLTPSP